MRVELLIGKQEQKIKLKRYYFPYGRCRYMKHTQEFFINILKFKLSFLLKN
jgi:hypothetical protein